MNNHLKKIALDLRRKGLSYSEIQKQIPVTKSTLSHWLHLIKLTKDQNNRLKVLMRTGQPYAARAQREIRIKKTEEIVSRAKSEIGPISDNELWCMGIMLYWAEGSKQKEHLLGQRVIFNNSDPRMIKIYLKWVIKFLKVDKTRINFEIYSHDNIKNREKEIINYWSTVTGFDELDFTKIYYKKDKKKIYRRNKGDNYFGLLRIIVTKSTDLNRRISGWISGICIQCEV